VKRLIILLALVLALAVLFAAGCKKPPPPQPPPPPPADTTEVVEEPEPEPLPPPPPPPLEMATIHFEFDKYRLTEESRDIIAANAAALEEHQTAIIRIEGHCDERGTDEYNMALGEKRAMTARDYLINYGISPDRISIISYGESRSVDPGHNEEAWAKNRRDDFIKVSE